MKGTGVVRGGRVANRCLDVLHLPAMIVYRASVVAVLGAMLAGCGPCDVEALQQRWQALVTPVQSADALQVLNESCDDVPSLSSAETTAVLAEQCPGVELSQIAVAAMEGRADFYQQCGLESLPLGSENDFVYSLGQPVLAAVMYAWLARVGISDALRTDIALAIRGAVALVAPTDSDWQMVTLPADSPAVEQPVGALVAASEQSTQAAIGTSSTYGDAWRLSQWVGLSAHEQGTRLGVVSFGHDLAPDAITLWLDGQGVHIYHRGRRLGAQQACAGAAICGSFSAADIHSRLSTVLADMQPTQVAFAAQPATPVTDVLTVLNGVLAWQPQVRERLALREPAPPPLPIVAEISAPLQALLAPIEQPVYTGAAVNALFDTMRPLGDQYCRMRTGMASRDEDALQAFAAGELLENPTAPLSSLKAGCWNFFRMNDQRPSDDFALIRALLPDDRLDCAGVGLLQPLMMHNEMGCETLTMIDFDWRILDVHSELVSLYEANAFAGDVALDDVLSQISLGWFARTEDAPPIQPASVSTLCNYRERPRCAAQIRRFQETWTDLHQMRLHLSALHDGTYIDTTATRVLFLSNATERFYTSDAQAEQLVNNLTRSLSGEQSAYLIHHTGGSREFGIYQLRNVDGQPAMSVVCRDVYHQTADWTRGTALADLPTYTIWVDTIAQTSADTPACRALVAQHLQ